jgi:hypothetical protein
MTVEAMTPASRGFVPVTAPVLEIFMASKTSFDELQMTLPAGPESPTSGCCGPGRGCLQSSPVE